MKYRSSKDLELKSAPVADYMKIRQYVVSLAERSTGPAMIPSMNELARDFGVTRMTVHKALKDLIRSRYLIVRKGIGTFINPVKLRDGIRIAHSVCIGIVVGDGKHCFFDAYYWDAIAALGRAVTAHPWNVKLVNLSASSPTDMAKEIRDNFIDAIAWIDPFEKNGQDTLRMLCSDGFPAVSFQMQIDGVDSVRMDWENHAYQVGLSLLEEGRRNIVFADYRDIPPVELQLKGLRKAFGKAGFKFNEGLVLRNFEDVDIELGRIMELGIDVQAVYLSDPSLPKIMPVLRKHGVDIKEHCRLVTEPFCLNEVRGFHGLVRSYCFDKMSETTIQIIEKRQHGDVSKRESKVFDFDIKMV